MFLEPLPAHAPVGDKAPGWALEDAAIAANRAARMREVELVQKARAALSLVPTLPAAHRLLADHYRARAAEAEARHDVDSAVEHLARLRAHDDGRHAAWIAGDGRLTLHTDPPGLIPTASSRIRTRLFRSVYVMSKCDPRRGTPQRSSTVIVAQVNAPKCRP